MYSSFHEAQREHFPHHLPENQITGNPPPDPKRPKRKTFIKKNCQPTVNWDDFQLIEPDRSHSIRVWILGRQLLFSLQFSLHVYVKLR